MIDQDGFLRRKEPSCGWDLAELWMISSLNCGWDLAECGWDLAEWLECLNANAKVTTVLGSIPASFLRHSGIRGAAEEAVLNKVLFKRNPSLLWQCNLTLSRWKKLPRCFSVNTNKLKSYMKRSLDYFVSQLSKMVYFWVSCYMRKEFISPGKSTSWNWRTQYFAYCAACSDNKTPHQAYWGVDGRGQLSSTVYNDQW